MNRKITAILVFVTCLISNAPMAAQQPVEAIQDIIDAYRDLQAFDGVILVRRGDDRLFHDYVASEPDSEPELPIHTSLPVASLSKPLTATVILALAQQNKLALTDTLDNYFPEFQSDSGKAITLAHLLSHRSGIPNHFEIEGWFNPAFHQSTSDKQFVQLIARLPHQFSPDTDYQYSNPGYFLLGKVIEQVTGLSLQQAFQQLLFNPARMSNSEWIFEMQSAPVDALIWKAGGGYKNQPSGDMRLFGAGAAIATTAEDLDNFIHALFETNALLNSKTKATMLNPDKPFSWRVQSAQLTDQQAITLINYDGKYQGYSSYLLYIPEHKINVVLLSRNGTSFQLKQQLASDLSAILLGLPVPDRSKDPVLHLVNALVSGDVPNQLNKIKAQGFELQPMSDIAYEILWSGLADEALATFSMIAKTYPENEVAQHNMQFACQHRLTQGAKQKATLCSFD